MTGTLTVSDVAAGRPVDGEDGGRWRNRRSEPGTRCRAAGPVRAARRGRLGLGLGQGLRLADRHHLHARLPARPRLLLDRRPDGRPRRPRLVADQPVPADERDAAVPGAGRRGRAVAAVAGRAGAARSRGPTARSSRSARRSCTSAASDGTTAQSTRRYVAQTVGTGNFDKWADGPGPARAARRRERRVRRRQHLRHRRASTPAARRPTTVFVLSPDARPARSASGRRRTTT